MFKIGKLIGKNGQLCWRTFKDDDRLAIMASADLNSTFSNQMSMVNSTAKKDLSVVTPSYTSRTGSQTPKTMAFTMSNPNPKPLFQLSKINASQSRELSLSKVDPEYDMLKFGNKKTLGNLDRKPTSEHVLEAHLKQIGQNKEMFT